MQSNRLIVPQQPSIKSNHMPAKVDYLIALIFPIWMSGTFMGMLIAEIYFSGNLTSKLIIVSSTLLWPSIFFMISKYRFIPRFKPPGDKVALALFLVFGLLSCTVSPIMFQSTSYFIVTVFTLLIVLQFKSNTSPHDIKVSLQVYSIITLMILLAVVKYDYAPGYRLGMRTGLLNPNSFGLIAMSVVITASAIKYQIIRYPIIFAAIGVIYLTGSRSAMLAAIIGFVVVNKYRVDALKKSQKILFWLFFALISVLLASYYIAEILDAIESFFKFTDKHRGFESGGSGRTIIWGWMWDVFLQYPITGVGYRAHGEFIQASSAHNGYLATLVDIGIVGFCAIMYLVIAGFYRLWNKLKDTENLHTYTTLFAFVVAYLALAMFERYLINVGNPASLLFMFSILGGFKNGYITSKR